jgi:hypothetical protein
VRESPFAAGQGFTDKLGCQGGIQSWGAETYVKLAVWMRIAACTELLTVLLVGAGSCAAQAQALLLLLHFRLSAQHHSTELPPQEATQSAAFTEDLFQRSLSLARQDSANSAHAWRLYGDWLWRETPDSTAVGAAEAAPAGSKPSFSLRAAEAYCQAAKNAASSGDVGGTMSALVRVIKACSMLLWPDGKTRHPLPEHPRR